MSRSPEVRARAKKIASYRKSKAAKASAEKKAAEAASKKQTGDCGDKPIRCKSLVIDGTKYRTLYNKKFENRQKWTPYDPTRITSVIPGTVVKITTKEGDKVIAGDDMLVLEAMKMKNRILFPEDGTVKSIKVKEGVKIPKGFLMVEMEA